MAGSRHQPGVRKLAFSIDFEGYTEAMQESFRIPAGFSRFEIESELQANTDRCLSLLSEHDVRGTFFVLGWIGERFPRIVRSIAEAGHEIGSHSYFHQRLTHLDHDQLEEVRRSKQVLEAATGVPVLGFRAPDFCLPEGEEFFEQLLDAGFTYDSSANPTTLHDVYGRTGASREIHRRPCGLIEFPPTTLALGRSTVITIAGGGYFRLFPWPITRRALERSPAPTTYLHPYEIGGHYPRDLPMSPLRRFRHGFRNGRLDRRLGKLFKTFHAISMRAYLESTHVAG